MTKRTKSDHLSRPVLIDICKDGTFTYRTKDQPTFNGAALPVFSVNSKEEARDLQIRFCKRQYERHPLMPHEAWYRLVPPQFNGEVEELPHVTQLLYDEYCNMKERDIARNS